MVDIDGVLLVGPVLHDGVGHRGGVILYLDFSGGFQLGRAWLSAHDGFVGSGEWAWVGPADKDRLVFAGTFGGDGYLLTGGVGSANGRGSSRGRCRARGGGGSRSGLLFSCCELFRVF